MAFFKWWGIYKTFYRQYVQCRLDPKFQTQVLHVSLHKHWVPCVHIYPQRFVIRFLRRRMCFYNCLNLHGVFFMFLALFSLHSLSVKRSDFRFQ